MARPYGPEIRNSPGRSGECRLSMSWGRFRREKPVAQALRFAAFPMRLIDPVMHRHRNPRSSALLHMRDGHAYGRASPKVLDTQNQGQRENGKIGRASSRERVCKYV